MIKNRIAQFLEERSLTVYRFYQETGISVDAAYKLNNDASRIPRGNTLKAMCDRYKVQPSEFIYWEEEGG
jgi:DNA-binding Xre family transcriptional regulator